MNDKYKTFEELKEEFGEDYEHKFYEMGLSAVKENERLIEELQKKDNIINELKYGIKELDNMFYETFRISQDGYFSISEWELKDFEDKIKELESK